MLASSTRRRPPQEGYSGTALDCTLINTRTFNVGPDTYDDHYICSLHESFKRIWRDVPTMSEADGRQGLDCLQASRRLRCVENGWNEHMTVQQLTCYVDREQKEVVGGGKGQEVSNTSDKSPLAVSCAIHITLGQRFFH